MKWRKDTKEVSASAIARTGLSVIEESVPAALIGCVAADSVWLVIGWNSSNRMWISGVSNITWKYNKLRILHYRHFIWRSRLEMVVCLVRFRVLFMVTETFILCETHEVDHHGDFIQLMRVDKTFREPPEQTRKLHPTLYYKSPSHKTCTWTHWH